MRLLLLALFALAQVTAPPQRASLRGVVVKWGSAEPLSQTIVELRAEGGGRPVASTGTSDRGEFAFSDIPAGRYRVFATRPGYPPAEYGQRRLNGTGQPIMLTAGEQKATLQISMSAGAAVFGRVVDRNGEPLPFADVRIEQVEYKGGRAGLVPVQSTITNDLGEYRIFWIAPGQYYIRASANNNQTFGGRALANPSGADTSGATFGFTTRPSAGVKRPVGLQEGESFAPIYYPATPDVQNASLLELRAGTELNVNFTIIPVRTRQLRGVVVDQATGQPVQGTLRVSLFPVDRYTQSGGTTLQFNPNNGVFQFSEMRSGSYELSTVFGDLCGRLLVDIADRDVDVTLRTLPLIKLSGRVRLDGQRPAGFPSDLSGLTQIAIRGTLAQLTGNVSATGDFEIQRVPVGGYQIGVQPFAPLSDLPLQAGATPGPAARPRPPVPASWQDAYLKSIQIGDQDVFNSDLVVDGQPVGPLEVIIGLDGGSIEGRSLNAKQEPVANAVVLLVPNSPPPIRSERYRSVSTNDAGHFQLRGIAPGDYTVYAWEDVDAGSWFNPAFMRLHEGSGRQMRIGEGQKETVDVRVIPVQ